MYGQGNRRFCNRHAEYSEGMKCGVLEWIKHSALRCFGYFERMAESEMTKRVYKLVVHGVDVRRLDNLQ